MTNSLKALDNLKKHILDYIIEDEYQYACDRTKERKELNTNYDAIEKELKALDIIRKYWTDVFEGDTKQAFVIRFVDSKDDFEFVKEVLSDV